jgi:hypothetical protein
LIARHWPDEVIALHDLATCIGKKCLLAEQLHAFRHDAEFELSCELQQGLNHHFARLVLANAIDEQAVELEAPDRKLRQVAQCGISGIRACASGMVAGSICSAMILGPGRHADRNSNERLVDMQSSELFAVSVKASSIISQQEYADAVFLRLMSNLQFTQYAIAAENELRRSYFVTYLFKHFRNQQGVF